MYNPISLVKHRFSFALLAIPVIAIAPFVSLQTSEEEKNIQFVKTYWDEVWSKGNLKGVEDFYHAKAIHGEDFSIEGFQQGVTSMRTAFPDLNVRLDDIFAQGNRVITRVTYLGTHTGRKMFGQDPLKAEIKVPGIDIFTIKDGKCVEHQHVADHLDLVRQMGIKLAPQRDTKIMEEEIRKVSKDYNDLTLRLRGGKSYPEKENDLKAVEQLLAEESIFVFNGEATSKSQELEKLKAYAALAELQEINDTKIIVLDENSAIETGVFHIKGKEGGKAFDDKYRFTTTWVYRKGKWQVVADQGSIIR